MREVDDIIQHYGVQGMKWGRRKTDLPKNVVVKADPGKRAKASGGYNRVASADAKKAAQSLQKAKASTVDSLTNKELKALNERLNLEKQYKQLVSDVRTPAGLKFIQQQLLQMGKQELGATTRGQGQIAELLKKKSPKYVQGALF